MDADQVARLAERVLALEDRLAILDLLAGSAHSSDVASDSFWAEMFSEDAVMDRGPGKIAHGREAILDVVRGSGQHDAAANGMSHLAMLPRLAISGDRAVATGYLLVVVADPSAAAVVLPGKGPGLPISLYHLTVNRWDLARVSGEWKVAARTIRPLGTEDAQSILDQGLDGRRIETPAPPASATL